MDIGPWSGLRSLAQLLQINVQQLGNPNGHRDQALGAGFAATATAHGPLLHWHAEQRSHARLVVIGQAQLIASLL